MPSVIYALKFTYILERIFFQFWHKKTFHNITVYEAYIKDEFFANLPHAKQTPNFELLNQNRAIQQVSIKIPARPDMVSRSPQLNSSKK